MRKRMLKRLLSGVLTLALLLTLLPTAAFAAIGELAGRSPVQNAALLAALEEAYGDDAEAMLAVLEEYGLLDEDGNPITDANLVVDGVEYTLEEIKAVLDDPATDLDKVAEVDGQFITLADLKTVIEIEEYLAYVEATYFTKQELSQAQIDNFYAMVGAMAGGDMVFLDGAAADSSRKQGPSGLNHDVEASVARSGDTYTVTLSGTQTAEVRFDWRVVGGSAAVTGETSGTGIIAAGDKSTSFPIPAPTAEGELDGSATYLVQIYNLENAVFEGNVTNWEEERVVEADTLKDYYASEEFSLKTSDNHARANNLIFAHYYEPNEVDGEDVVSETWGKLDPDNLNPAFEPYWNVQEDAAEVSFGSYHIPDGNYQTGMVVHSAEFNRVFRDLTADPDWTPETARQRMLRMIEIFFCGPPEDREGDGEISSMLLERTPTVRFYLNDKGTYHPFYDEDAATPAVELYAYDKSLEYIGAPLEATDTYPGTPDWFDPESGRVSPTEPLSLGTEIPDQLRVGFGFTSGNVMGNVLWTSYYTPGMLRLSYVPEMTSCEGEVFLQETTRAATVSFSVPEGTYYPGQSVPITASFTYPVQITDEMCIYVNGEEAKPAEGELGSISETCTFLYPVPDSTGKELVITGTNFDGDDNADVVWGANKLGMTIRQKGGLAFGTAAPNTELEYLNKRASFTDYNAKVTTDPETQQPQLQVTVDLKTNEDGTAHKDTLWLDNDLETVDGQKVVKSLKFLSSATTGPQNLVYDVENNKLTATIPLEPNDSEQDKTVTVDFQLDSKVVIGSYQEDTLSGSHPVAAEDLDPVLTVGGKDGEEAVQYQQGESTPTIYLQEGRALDLSFELEEGFTWGDTSKTAVCNGTEADDPLPTDGSAHFVWRSSNPAAAQVSVDRNGKATLAAKGAGRTEITLTALNGPMADVVSGPITVTFDVGQDPFLLIPDSGKTVNVLQGQDATVHWSSNLCQKNYTADENGNMVEGTTLTPTTFTVTLIPILNGEEQEPVTKTLTTSGTNPVISSVTFPWNELEAYYEDGVRTFRVEVSAQYLDNTYGTYMPEGGGTKVEDATATLKFTSRPAGVTLHQPDGGLYQVGADNKTVTLHWTTEDLDLTADGGGRFELYIASTALPEGPISETSTEEEGGPRREGDDYYYDFQLPDVELDPGDPASYRNSYSISVKVKNSAESTWSYSSYILYDYSPNALEILVDGAAYTDGTLKMSNVEEIKRLWGRGGENGSQAIVKLQRDIALKHVISINYGAYAWAQVADMIAWNSSNSQAATVNYQQGALYENIENFSYTAYRPATDFVLSGLRDGETTISATHANTGMGREIDVTVETLRDQLYLFQCYPKLKTELTYTVYTDSSRTATETHTLNTNDDGEAAIYAPHGIAGDVYCKSDTTVGDEEVTYLGTIYHRNLVSSEADSTKLQLYPVNTLQLRRAAQAEIFLKNPDGTPYANQQVTFRGGVYRQGEYCVGRDNSGVQFGLQNAERDAWQTSAAADKAQTVTTGADGRLLVTMDLSQFSSESHTEDIQAGEKLYYLFQLEYGDGSDASYYPIFLRVDATLNMSDVASTGDSIVAWEENKTTGGADGSASKTPFVSQQTLQYSQAPGASVADVRKSTGSVGPSTTFPQAWLTTDVMWWGDADAAGRPNTVQLQDTNGKVPQGQTSQVITYPFTDMVFTQNVLTMDQENMRTWGVEQGGKRGLRLTLSRDGVSTDRILTLPFQMVNMIGVEQAEDSSALPDAIQGAQDSLNINNVPLSGGDKLIQTGMSLIAGDSTYDSSQDKFAIRLFATSDPTVFRAFLCVNVGNMESGGNNTGVYPDYTKSDDMIFASASGELAGGDFDKMPNALNVYDMVKGNYLKKVDEEGTKSAAGKGTRSLHFDVGGYYEANIAYNSESGKWEFEPITGGFHLGGGASYSWNVNMLVGPVPVNISLTLGGTIEIAMDMQKGNYYTVSGGVNDLASAADEATFQTLLSQKTYTEESGSDYLTSLRIFLYIRVFAGIGFDISILAFKVGVFGQLNGDFELNWLNRSYLGGSNISAVGPIDSRTDDVLNGQVLKFSGSTGIEFVFKFLFISYEKVFCSVGFQVTDKTGQQAAIEEIWAGNKTINNRPVQRVMMPNGQAMYAVDLGPQLESRDYVDIAPQEWMGGAPAFSPLSLHPKGDAFVADVLQGGAYSYANPVLSDDGEIMFYLSDRKNPDDINGAKDVTQTRAAVSTKGDDGKFQLGVRFDGNDGVPEGYGDSSVKVAGTEDGCAAVWVRQMENITPEQGNTLTTSDQMLQMNSSEIVAAIYDSNGKTWKLTRLTDNSTPDLAPVVATNGDRTVVAWREVSTTGAESLTDFDQHDAIRYAVYEDGNWEKDENNQIAVQTLYDGEEATAIKGIEAAMLADGTAAVVYTLDTDSTDGANTDWETVLALIPSETNSKLAKGDPDVEVDQSQDTVLTFRLTTNDELDENPQITTAKFGAGSEAIERFVVAWHAQEAVTGDAAKAAGSGDDTESNIRLAVVDGSGAQYERMPESLSAASAGTGAAIGSNFRFAKQSENIKDLTILWVDSVAGETTGTTPGYEDTGYDVLKAVQFVEDGASYTVSGIVEVAEMPEKTLIDHFDAYMDNGAVKSVILGTNYSQTMEEKVIVSDGDIDTEMAMTVAIPVSGMYTAEAKFTNQFDVSAVMLEYDKLYPNSDIDVQFTIRNNGKAPITKLEIVPTGGAVGAEPYYTTDDDPLYGSSTGKRLNLMPNQDITVTARITNGSTIQNVDYQINAYFGGDTTPVSLSEDPSTLHLDIPDVGVSKVETTQEQDGVRTLRYSLYNDLSAPLSAQPGDGQKWRVQVGFYADQACTTLLKDGEDKDLLVTIEDENTLKLIDDGGYSAEVKLPVKNYMTGGDGAAQEIPADGIQIFVKAWIETPREDGSFDTVSEYLTDNNSASVKLENLAVRRGTDVTVDADLSNPVGAGGSTVTVTAQYNKLTGTASGNLIVTLLGPDGAPIERMQSYTSAPPTSRSGDSGGGFTLSGEEIRTETFPFTQQGVDANVQFSNMILGEGNVELEYVSLTGAQVTYDPDTKTYTATGTDLTSGVLDIVPKDPQNAKITVNGTEYDMIDWGKIPLTFGQTTWTITVTNTTKDFMTTKETYTLVLNNTDSTYVPPTPDQPGTSGGGSGGSDGSNGSDVTYPVAVPGRTEGGAVTVTPSRAHKGDTVTITVKPDAGYELAELTVTDSRGNPLKLTDKGGGRYTFTMPASQVNIQARFTEQQELSPWLNPFVDVQEAAWYYDAVRYVHQNGLMTGTSATTFSPDVITSRAMIVTILWRMAGSPDMEGENWGYPYADVDAESWYGTAVYWARHSGVANGYSDERFGPEDPITREQLAVMLYRYAGQPPAPDLALTFSDAGQISGFADSAMRWAVDAGILSGKGGNLLDPKGQASRAEAAAMLMRFLSREG